MLRAVLDDGWPRLADTRLEVHGAR